MGSLSGAFASTLLLGNGEIYSTTSTKKFPLGTRGFTRDGRVYRYARCGATALTPGQLCQAEAVDANFVAQPLADSTDWDVPTTGSTVIYLSTATSMATADAFVDGYFMVTAGSTGNATGQIARIESCPASTATAGPAYCPEIFLAEGESLVTALTTTYTVSIQKNPYDDVIPGVYDAAITGIPVGVCPTNVAATYYFWLQTWGMTCVWVNGTLDAGHMVIYTSDTGCTNAGTVAPCSTKGFNRGDANVGLAQYIGSDGTAGSIFLTLAP